jgi:hypothetical protein
MENIFEKLQSKRKEEIDFERENLKNIIKNFGKKKQLLEDKNTLLTEEMEASSANLLKVNNEIENINKSDIKDVIQNILDQIGSNKQNISKHQELFLKETQNINSMNELKNKEINDFENEKDTIKKLLEKKKESKYFIIEKINELIKSKEKLEKNLDNIITKIKELKNEMKLKIFDNVARRQNIIQEYINNQEIKKKIDKNKEKMFLMVEEKENELKNFRTVKNSQRDDILNTYNDKLIQGVPNIMEEMANIEETLRIFDLETEKELYFLKNKIKSLHKKILNNDKFLQTKMEIQNDIIYKNTNHKQIQDLEKNKLKIEEKVKELNIDITFLEKEYDSEISQILNTKNQEDNKFLDLKDNKEKEIIENELLLANYVKQQKVNINNEKKKNSILEIELTNIKDNYYNSLRKLEVNKDDILKFQRTYESKIRNNNDIKKKDNQQYLTKQKNIENRILYLEKQHFELTIKENEMRK